MRHLVRVFDFTSLACFSAMMVCVLTEVVARNIIEVPTTWVEELSRLLFIYTIFIGSASAWYRGSHIIINILPRRLKARPQRILKIVVEVMTLIFLLCAWGGAIYMMVYNYSATSTALEISISYFYLGLFIGVTGILIFHIRQIAETVAGFKAGPETMARVP
jgi:TRAP-type C4-dicarboxylate transport system permease small subunit